MGAQNRPQEAPGGDKKRHRKKKKEKRQKKSIKSDKKIPKSHEKHWQFKAEKETSTVWSPGAIFEGGRVSLGAQNPPQEAPGGPLDRNDDFSKIELPLS